jgi:hypothetical protein
LHGQAALTCTHQGFSDIGTGTVEVENIGFQLHPISRTVNGRNQSRKKIRSALQQLRTP